jgi:hypothetical protein
MKKIPYIALTLGGLGLLSLVISFFIFSFCYVTLGLFGAAIILFMICTMSGACCAYKEGNKKKTQAGLN